MVIGGYEKRVSYLMKTNVYALCTRKQPLPSVTNDPPWKMNDPSVQHSFLAAWQCRQYQLYQSINTYVLI
jgi:hypothetical protein